MNTRNDDKDQGLALADATLPPPCKIEWRNQGELAVCNTCGVASDTMDPIECPWAPKQPDQPHLDCEKEWPVSVSFAVLFLSICLGLSTCQYVEHRIKVETPPPQKATP